MEPLITPTKEVSRLRCKVDLSDYQIKLNNIVIKKTDEKFKRFNEIVDKLNLSKEVSILFRGGSKNYFSARFNISEKEDFFNVFSDLIFLLGDKSKMFLQSYDYGLNNASISTTSLSRKNFGLLLRKIRKIHKGTKNPNIKEALSSIYFSQHIFDPFCNVETQLNKIKEAPKKEQKQQLDLLLLTLHRFGKVAHFEESNFLSTTTNMKTAKLFAGHCGFVLVGWQYLWSEMCRENFQLNMALKETTLFQDQCEYSIKYGLVPNFLLGFIDLNTNTFHINPFVFNQSSSSTDQIICTGLFLKQFDFHRKIKSTAYKAYFAISKDQFQILNI